MTGGVITGSSGSAVGALQDVEASREVNSVSSSTAAQASASSVGARRRPQRRGSRARPGTRIINPVGLETSVIGEEDGAEVRRIASGTKTGGAVLGGVGRVLFELRGGERDGVRERRGVRTLGRLEARGRTAMSFSPAPLIRC